MTRFSWRTAAAIAGLVFALAAGSAEARTSKSSGPSARATHASTKTAGTHFIRKTCKTASCKQKHPSGEYMLPVKPKKTG
jgi:hypothetical protein